jgi:hypothetical protein
MNEPNQFKSAKNMDKLIEIIKDRSFKQTILLTLIYFGIGFSFLHFGLASYGWIFFVLLPFSLGFAVGKMEKQKWAYLGLYHLSSYFYYLHWKVCFAF